MAIFQVFFYVPESHLQAVKQAMFAAGAGRIGDYESCAWQVKGLGQFRPLAGSQPFIGVQDKLEQLDEYRVEMVCEKSVLKLVIEALFASHPYEEPAYGVLRLLDSEEILKG